MRCQFFRFKSENPNFSYIPGTWTLTVIIGGVPILSSGGNSTKESCPAFLIILSLNLFLVILAVSKSNPFPLEFALSIAFNFLCPNQF